MWEGEVWWTAAAKSDITHGQRRVGTGAVGLTRTRNPWTAPRPSHRGPKLIRRRAYLLQSPDIGGRRCAVTQVPHPCAREHATPPTSAMDAACLLACPTHTTYAMLDEPCLTSTRALRQRCVCYLPTLLRRGAAQDECEPLAIANPNKGGPLAALLLPYLASS